MGAQIGILVALVVRYRQEYSQSTACVGLGQTLSLPVAWGCWDSECLVSTQVEILDALVGRREHSQSIAWIGLVETLSLPGA